MSQSLESMLTVEVLLPSVVAPVEVSVVKEPGPAVIEPEPRDKEAAVTLPDPSTMKLLVAAEKFVPTVALLVVVRVPNAPSPVVWTVPEPELRETAVIAPVDETWN